MFLSYILFERNFKLDSESEENDEKTLVRGMTPMMNHLLFFNKIIILISTLYKSNQLM